MMDARMVRTMTWMVEWVEIARVDKQQSTGIAGREQFESRVEDTYAREDAREEDTCEIAGR